MENKKTDIPIHLDPMEHVVPPKESKKDRYSFAIYILMASLTLVGACSVVYALVPTAEEVMQRQLELNGQEWSRWDSTEKEALGAVERAREAKNALHEQSESMRAFFKGETPSN